MLLAIPEGTIGLAYDMISDAKLVLTDELIAASLADRKAQGLRSRRLRRHRRRDRNAEARRNRRNRPTKVRKNHERDIRQPA